MKNVLLSSLFCCLVIGQIRADDGGMISAFGRGAVWATAGFVGSGLGTYIGVCRVAVDDDLAENAQNGGYRTEVFLASTYLAGVAGTYLIKRLTGMNDRASTAGLCVGASVIPAFVGYHLWQDRPSNRQNAMIQSKRRFVLENHARIFTEENIRVEEGMRMGVLRDGIGRITAYWTLLTPEQREQYVTDPTVRLNIVEFLRSYNQGMAGLTNAQIRDSGSAWTLDALLYRSELEDTGLLDQPND
jgi:hypothetical protein